MVNRNFDFRYFIGFVFIGKGNEICKNSQEKEPQGYPLIRVRNQPIIDLLCFLLFSFFKMMKQWQFTRSGNPRDVLTMVEVPIPTTCADDEVLVQVSHVSLNPAIAYRLIAYYGFFDPLGALMGKPAVPELDFSGIVCDFRGKSVKEFKTGLL